MKSENEFVDIDGKVLVIEKNKKTVIFKAKSNFEDYGITFEFDEKTFVSLRDYLRKVSSEIWDSVVPKDAVSSASDYYEYYDKEFDNNGYLTVRDYWLNFERPVLHNVILYKINKRKMETLLFDLSD